MPIIKWVASFLNDRTAALRLDRKTGDQEPIKIEVSQRSPVAPIFFILFTAPQFKILTKEDKIVGVKIRGYVDDGFLTSRAPKKDISIAKIQEGIHICLDNLGVASNAGGVPKSSSQKVFKQFRDLAEGWLQTGKEMSVQWIPGHTGITESKLADQEVKKHAKLPPAAELNLEQILSNAKRKLRKMKDTNWQLE